MTITIDLHSWRTWRFAIKRSFGIVSVPFVTVIVTYDWRLTENQRFAITDLMKEFSK